MSLGTRICATNWTMCGRYGRRDIIGSILISLFANSVNAVRRYLNDNSFMRLIFNQPFDMLLHQSEDTMYHTLLWIYWNISCCLNWWFQKSIYYSVWKSDMLKHAGQVSSAQYIHTYIYIYKYIYIYIYRSLQLHLHSWLNTWLHWIGQRQLQYIYVIMATDIYVWRYGASYIRDFTVYTQCIYMYIYLYISSYDDDMRRNISTHFVLYDDHKEQCETESNVSN